MTASPSQTSKSGIAEAAATGAGAVVAILALDAEKCVIEASPVWFARFGGQPGETIGRDWRQFLSPRSRGEIESRFAAAEAADQRIVDMSCEVLGDDGRVFNVLLSGYAPPRAAESAPAWRLFFTDVSALEAARRRLEATATQFRGLLDEVDDVVTISRPTGEFEFVNRAYAAMHGRRSDEMLGRSIWEFIPEHEKPGVAAHFQRVRRSRSYIDNENTVVAADGRIRRFAWRNRVAVDGDGHVVAFYSFGQDIEARRVAETALVETRDRLAMALEASNLAIWEYDVARARIALDERWAAMLDFERETIVAARQILRLIHRDDRTAVLDAVRAAISGQSEKFSLQARLRGADGTWRWLRCDGRVGERDAAGRAIRIVGAVVDISTSKATEARIHQMAFVDPLTGLPNRALFIDRLQRVIAKASAEGARAAVLFADLDRFKEINDTLGHDVGDRVLAEVADGMHSAVRKGDLFARLGGDEFGVLGFDIEEREAVQVAHRLVASLQREVVAGDDAFRLGVSVGVALFPSDGSDADLLLRNAEIAMYRAKARRSGVARYDAAMSSGLAERLSLARDLAEALNDDALGELQLHYQPQVDMRNGALVGAEALMRWRHPRLGPISPVEFLPLAEERGMMAAVGAWVMRQACRQLAQWRAAGLKFPGRLAINVAAEELDNEHFFEDTVAFVEDFGLTPSMIELELTESGIMQNVETSIETFRRLKDAGFSIALDDFGAGYSSLAQLTRLPVAKLKIDRAFVRDMTESEQGRAITATIVAMSQTLGMQTIAEGVETDGQRAALLQLGCAHAQGYLFGRPEPAAVFAASWLSARVDPPAKPAGPPD